MVRAPVCGTGGPQFKPERRYHGLEHTRVTIVGAGVVGLCVALEVQARGAEVTLVDEGGGENASSVAAGMIAPAFEAALEEPAEGRLALLLAARGLWNDVAGGMVTLHREGALWADFSADGAGLASVEAALRRAGALHERLSGDQARELAPGLSEKVAGAVFAPEDWRLDSVEALQAMIQVFSAKGGRREHRAVRNLAVEQGSSDAVVLCAGWGSRRFEDTAPELSRLRSVGGELVHFAGAGPRGGPVVRTKCGYLVPGRRGLIAGASMVAGAEFARTTAEGQARYAALARAWFPGIADARAEGAAGVRAATPDGLPLVGRSRCGVHLATGFRRNGWLLAPLAARITADQLAGRDPGEWAGAFRPDRFA